MPSAREERPGMFGTATTARTAAGELTSRREPQSTPMSLVCVSRLLLDDTPISGSPGERLELLHGNWRSEGIEAENDVGRGDLQELPIGCHGEDVVFAEPDALRSDTFDEV